MENMLVRFMEKVLELGTPNYKTISNKTYVDRKMYSVQEPTVDPLTISTLRGLVDYIKDAKEDNNGFLITIDGHGEVNLRSMTFGPYKQREHYAKVIMNVPKIQFDTYMDQEQFIISLNAKFVPTDDLDLIRRTASTIVDQEEVQLVDNGQSQSVTVKQGVAKVGEATIKPIVSLTPFRTFLEVTQPTSQFLFRVQKGGRFALYEADGGAWRIEAMSNIYDYLKKNLSDEIEGGVVVVII